MKVLVTENTYDENGKFTNDKSKTPIKETEENSPGPGSPKKAKLDDLCHAKSFIVSESIEEPVRYLFNKVLTNFQTVTLINHIILNCHLKLCFHQTN